MSIFNPEYKEGVEFDFEANKFSQQIEAQLQRALATKKEVFADIILCPNASCGTPLKVVLEDDTAQVSCVNCGWSTVVKVQK